MHPAPIPFVPRTKLRPPRLPDDILVRTRLLERLNRAQTLALIIAPAGYGKPPLPTAGWRSTAARMPGLRWKTKTMRRLSFLPVS